MAVTLLTGALVLITAYYAAQNRAMVQAMKAARDAALLPHLGLDFLRLGPTAMTLVVRNVGPGAALKVDVTVTWIPRGDESSEEFRWRRNVLVSGGQADFMPPGELNDNLNTLPERFESVTLTGTMRDAAGSEHAVAETFDQLAEWRSVLGEARQRFVTESPDRRLAEAFEPHLDRIVTAIGRRP